MRWLLALLWVGCAHASGVHGERTSPDVPTAEAIAARLELGTTELDDASIERLAQSSVRWIEHLHQTGMIARLREGRCESSSKEGISLSELAPVEPSRASTDLEELILSSVFWRASYEDPSCDAAYRALHALAVTRAYFASHAMHRALSMLDAAVDAISPAPVRDCVASDRDALETAVFRHFFELSIAALPVGFSDDACIHAGSLLAANGANETASIRAASDGTTPVAQLVVASCSAGTLFSVDLRHDGSDWHVTQVSQAACLAVAGCE